MMCLIILSNPLMASPFGESITIPQAIKPIIVFDIDETLAFLYNPAQHGTLEHHPECPKINISFDNNNEQRHEHYICAPYLRELFQYLDQKGARIVFFSAGLESRNVSLVDTLMRYIFQDNETAYPNLYFKGHFKVYSRHHLINNKKDLNIIDYHEGESLENAILIDDKPEWRAPNQDAMIQAFRFSLSNEEPFFHDLAKNTTYYLIGLFKLYFNDSEKTPITLGEYVSNISLGLDCMEKQYALLHRLVSLGLEHVRLTTPDATYYPDSVHHQTFLSLPTVATHIETMQRINPQNNTKEIEASVSQDHHVIFPEPLHDEKEEYLSNDHPSAP